MVKTSVYSPDKGIHHSVFRHFKNGLEEIDFLPVVGTTVNGQRKIKAIVKAKMGLKRASQLRRTASDLTVHCFPEDFDDVANIQDVIGSAIRWCGCPARQVSLLHVEYGIAALSAAPVQSPDVRVRAEAGNYRLLFSQGLNGVDPVP